MINVKNVKNNYSHGYIEFSCPCCEVEADTQEHMFTTCNRLTSKLTPKEYRAIFGQNEDEIEKVASKIEIIEFERHSILESQ